MFIICEPLSVSQNFSGCLTHGSQKHKYLKHTLCTVKKSVYQNVNYYNYVVHVAKRILKHIQHFSTTVACLFLNVGFTYSTLKFY